MFLLGLGAAMDSDKTQPVFTPGAGGDTGGGATSTRLRFPTTQQTWFAQATNAGPQMIQPNVPASSPVVSPPIISQDPAPMPDPTMPPPLPLPPTDMPQPPPGPQPLPPDQQPSPGTQISVGPAPGAASAYQYSLSPLHIPRWAWYALALSAIGLLTLILIRRR